MPNETDDSRLTDKNRGANVVDLDEYRNRSVDDTNTSTPLFSPATMSALHAAIVLLGVLSLLAMLRISR